MKKTGQLLAIAFCTTLVLQVRAEILTGPITNNVNGHAYYLLSPTNWNAAEAIATGLGGHLATVNDASENAWIYSTFANYGGAPRSLWLGLNDVIQEGLWVWNDGDATAYRNWAPGEPNSGGGFYPDEDQAHMRSPDLAYPGMWNDAPGDQNHCAVVEIGPAPQPLPVILAGPITNLANGHIYYLLSATNWHAAEAIATGLGGHLATVNDASENAWIYSTFGNYGGAPRSLWLGLNDVTQEGLWVWNDADAAPYRNWAPGEPNSGGGFYPDEDQAHMRSPDIAYPGMWNDAPGDQNHCAVVEIRQPQIIASRIKVSVVDLCWDSATNGLYQLQYRTNLTTSPWFNIGIPIRGTGLEMCTPIDMPAGQAGKFYRVLGL